MASILSDIGANVGSELKSLSTRLTSAETAIVNLGGQEPPPPTGNFTIEPVTWTNLTEINLSGEKLLNTNFDPPPLGLGVKVEVLISWTNGGKVASVGEVYEIDLVQSNGGMRLTNSSQSLFASANQLVANVRSLHPVQYVADSTLTSSGSGAHPVKIIVLTSVNLQGTVFTAGSILHGVGFGGTNSSLQRMEDPNDPRDYPYTTSNQNTGTWDWEQRSDRGTTWEYAREQSFPTNWSTHGSIPLDQDKLTQGIIKGSGGGTHVQQIFSNPIASGTKLVAKVTRADNNENGEVRIQTLRSNGQSFGTNKNIPYADGFVEFETTETTYGIRLSTAHGTREVGSVSLFQGEVSGGSVQVNGNGGLERISGINGWNAGASSSTSLDGNSNGYVQFQWGAEFKSLRIGFTYLDENYNAIEPFQLVINGSGQVYTNGSNNFNQNDFSEVGDFFRIRHSASSNQVHFQKRQIVYGHDTSFVFETASGSNYSYPSEQRPLVIALLTQSGLTDGEYYRDHAVRESDQAMHLKD